MVIYCYRMNFQSATALVTYRQTLMGMSFTFLMRIWIMIPVLFLPLRGLVFRRIGVYYGGKTLKISMRYCFFLIILNISSIFFFFLLILNFVLYPFHSQEFFLKHAFSRYATAKVDSTYLEPSDGSPSALLYKCEESSQTEWTTIWMDKDNPEWREFCGKR